MNPAQQLLNLLNEYAPAKIRGIVHVVILLAGIIVTAILSANGDWKQGLISLAVAVYALANKANTVPSDTNADRGEDEPEQSADADALAADPDMGPGTTAVAAPAPPVAVAGPPVTPPATEGTVPVA